MFVHVKDIPKDLYSEVLEGREIVFAVGSSQRDGETFYHALPTGLVATLAAEADQLAKIDVDQSVMH